MVNRCDVCVIRRKHTMRSRRVALLLQLATLCGGIAVPRRRLLVGGGGALGGGALGLPAAAAPPPRKTFVVTGASSGIGFAAAGELVARGHRVVVACRTRASAAATAEKLGAEAPARGCELADLTSVAAFADDVVATADRVDGLLCIAGVDGAPRAGAEEPHFASNYLGHALLARTLLPKLRASRGRFVTVASTALLDADLAKRPVESLRDAKCDPHVAYANSKACCVLLADETRRRAPELAVAACALPGRVATQIVRYELPQRAAQRAAMTPEQLARQARQLGLRTPAEGAALPVWLADDDAARGGETLWLDPGVPARLDAAWRDGATARALYDATSAILGAS